MRKLKCVAIICPLLVLVFSCSNTVEITETRELSLSAGSVEFIEIHAGPGALDITGVPGGRNITAEAKVIATGRAEKEARQGNGSGFFTEASTETGQPAETEGKPEGEKTDSIENKVELDLEKRGNRAVLTARAAPTLFFLDWFDFGTNLIHLDVRVPDTIEVRVWDSDGDMYIQNMKSPLIIEDGAGNITVENSRGEMEIRDEAGDIFTTDFTGEITISDEAGDIELTSVRGDISIDDNQGNITIENVTGDISLYDKTGSIIVETVTGDVKITGGGKGNVRIRNIDGNIQQNVR
jgi:DUF4097 and DUF4098 domain-containing protein YvlB